MIFEDGWVVCGLIQLRHESITPMLSFSALNVINVNKITTSAKLLAIILIAHILHKQTKTDMTFTVTNYTINFTFKKLTNYK